MIPARLYNGYLLIYGAPSITGIVPNSSGFQFGLVNQIYDNVSGDVSLNQSIMFRYDDSITVTYDGQQYFLLEEQKVILIENPLS